MLIKVYAEVIDDLLEETWTLYRQAFEELNALTVQRHLMYRDEFDAVMADTRIDKWVVSASDGTVLGLSVYTNDLDAWPLISPAYFERRWPDAFRRHAIWYCGFVAVPGHHIGVFTELIEAMYRRAEEQRGVISLDICRHNIETYHLDVAVAKWLNRISGGQVRCEAADTQTSMVYETAAGAAP